ncbi:MAG: hypothetical protein AB1758_01330, partial [Candidatus Eremiobacterota bacterium]
MAQFTYKALDANGQVRSGILDAADRAHALRLLSDKGLNPRQLDMIGGPRPSSPSAAARTVPERSAGPASSPPTARSHGPSGSAPRSARQPQRPVAVARPPARPAPAPAPDATPGWSERCERVAAKPGFRLGVVAALVGLGLLTMLIGAM